MSQASSVHWLQRLKQRLGRFDSPAVRTAKRIIVGVVGVTLLLIGVALLVLPGPGLVVILVGLSLLATEFVIARIWMRRLRRLVRKMPHLRQKKNPSKQT